MKRNSLLKLGAGFLASAALLLAPGAVRATTLTANGSSDTYALISAAGFGNENPDCVHGSFGQHVTQTFDSTLGKQVFVFHSHITADNDRCTNLDRVRMEIKGGAGSPSDMQHTSGQTAYYRWKFRLASDFVGSSSFTHIFQIKALGGDEGAPLITITPRATTLQVIHSSGEGSGSKGTIAQVNLAPFKGTWVEAYVKYKSSEGSAGTFEISLKRVSDGATLLSHTDNAIDMWRTGASYNRGKWGVYRSKDATKKDEQVRFADFCVSETSEGSCPSSIGSGSGITGNKRIVARHSGKDAVVQSASTADGANIFQYSYASGSTLNDEWQIISIGSGYHRIVNRHSGKDMVVQSASTADGANVFQWPYGGSNTNDEWQFVDLGNGYYRIVNRHSGKSLEVAGGSTSNSANIQQNTYTGATHQQWQLINLP